MRIEHDPEADAVYIRLSSKNIARTRTVRRNRSDAAIDYASDGTVVGVELLGVSRGIDLHGLPEAEKVRALLDGLALAVLPAVEVGAS